MLPRQENKAWVQVTTNIMIHGPIIWIPNVSAGFGSVTYSRRSRQVVISHAHIIIISTLIGEQYLNDPRDRTSLNEI